MWRGERLVTRTFRPGLAARRSATNGAAAETCSKLSSTSNRRRPRRASSNVSFVGRVPSSRTRRARATAGATRRGSRSTARETKPTPSANASRRSDATWMARRVLPTPPGPVRVSKRTSGRRRVSTTAAMSLSRPISGEGASGRSDPKASSSATSTSVEVEDWVGGAGKMSGVFSRTSDIASRSYGESLRGGKVGVGCPDHREGRWPPSTVPPRATSRHALPVSTPTFHNARPPCSVSASVSTGHRHHTERRWAAVTAHNGNGRQVGARSDGKEVQVPDSGPYRATVRRSPCTAKMADSDARRG